MCKLWNHGLSESGRPRDFLITQWHVAIVHLIIPLLHLWQTSLIYHGILSQWAGIQLQKPYYVMQNVETICCFLGSSTPCLPVDEKIKIYYKEIRPSGGRDSGPVSWPLGQCLFFLFSHNAHTTDSYYVKQCWITQWGKKLSCLLTFWSSCRKYPSLMVLGL